MSCGLLFLLIPLMAKLAMRVQPREVTPNQKPVPIKSTSTTNPDNEPRSAAAPESTELTARIQQLEDALARRPTGYDVDPQPCPLTSPTMPFFQAR